MVSENLKKKDSRCLWYTILRFERKNKMLFFWSIAEMTLVNFLWSDDGKY